MKARHLLFLTFALFISKGVYSQQIESDTICQKDTFLRSGILILPKDFPLEDYSNAELVTFCDYKKNLGFRFDFGFSQYLYSKQMGDWLGYHQGTNINGSLALKKLNFGFRFKPWTTNPKSELTFNNKTLPKSADVDPFKFDIYVGYEIYLSEKVSIEPSFGYTICAFKVINEDEIKKNFSFNKTSGLLAGLTINKYIPLMGFNYIVLFGRVTHGFVDYSEVHPELKGQYTEISAGVSYKFYCKKRVYNKIKSNPKP